MDRRSVFHYRWGLVGSGASTPLSDREHYTQGTRSYLMHTVGRRVKCCKPDATLAVAERSRSAAFHQTKKRVRASPDPQRGETTNGESEERSFSGLAMGSVLHFTQALSTARKTWQTLLVAVLAYGIQVREWTQQNFVDGRPLLGTGNPDLRSLSGGY